MKSNKTNWENPWEELQKLNLVDKFLFDQVMEDKEAYEAVISILLENEITLIEKPETEKELRVSPKLREVRLDVVSMDKEGKLYHTEMQKRNTGNLRKRSRYYQAQMDVSLLEPGTADFNLLNDSCMIIISPFDVFGKGLLRYTFEGICRECPELRIEDGAVRIFINTKGNNRNDFSQEFLDFMDYLTETRIENADKINSKKILTIHKRVEQIRLSEKEGIRLMQKWEEIAEARSEGEKIGKEMSQIALICKKIMRNKGIEQIAEELEEDVSSIRKIYDTAVCFAPEYDVDQIYEELYE